MDIRIEEIVDTYECELCGYNSATGYKVYYNGLENHSLIPIPSCYDDIGFSIEDVMKLILNDLGHTVEIVREE